MKTKKKAKIKCQYKALQFYQHKNYIKLQLQFLIETDYKCASINS